jgi:nitroreductase
MQAIKERKSVRTYREEDIEPVKLSRVLEAARLAPSANNRQEWKFIVVKDLELRRKIAMAASSQTFVGQAPVIIVACATESESVMKCGQPRYTVDVSIAMAFMLLQAREEGLGTCWIGAFDENAVKQVLDIPAEVRVVAMTPLGFPAVSSAQKPRKNLDQIVCFEKYA